MADNHISIIVTSNRLASKLREVVDQQQRYRDMLAYIKKDMDQMIEGSNYATLEAQFGIPTGKGQTVYNLVAGSLAEIDADVNLNQLLSWLSAAY